MPETKNLPTLIINRVESSDVFQKMQNTEGTIKPDELYFVNEGGANYQMLAAFTANVPVQWTAQGNYFYQEISVAGMKEAYNPICDCVYGDDMAANETYKEAWGNVLMVETFDNKIKIWCTKAPEVAFTIRMSVVGIGLNVYAEGDEVAF